MDHKDAVTDLCSGGVDLTGLHFLTPYACVHISVVYGIGYGSAQHLGMQLRWSIKQASILVVLNNESFDHQNIAGFDFCL